ncbi:MAG TPA: tetratricopeptide repeat protein [Alphaproteobacteria bacterium]|jgi:tetratricopeptide (TPR) repeat protein|nr:tetratricopeptide repeat protein [Alphaproteobacteria bacterium]
MQLGPFAEGSHNQRMPVLRLGLLTLLITMAPSWGKTGWANQNDTRLDSLFSQLQITDSGQKARTIEKFIWKIWRESGDESVDQLMVDGVKAMGGGNYEGALIAFNSIVKGAPNFAEGWNKRATLYWLMGDFEKSVEDINRTLALEPRHFGALSGLAMIRESQERPLDALQAFERALEIYPAMPNAAERIRKLNRQLGESI